MTLIKQSERTLRSGCKRCGSLKVYWAKDDQTGKFVLIDARDLAQAAAKGGKVPSDYVHSCAKDGKQVDKQTMPPRPGQKQQQPADSKLDPETDALVDRIAAEQPEPQVAPQPEEPEVPAAKGPEAQALDALRSLFAPTVSREDLAAIVKAELDGLVFPTRTVVIREKTKQPEAVDGPTHYAFAEVLEWLMCGEHVLMVGPAGTGKSTIGKQASKALKVPYGAISLNPQTPKSDLFGYKDANGNYHGTVFRDRCNDGGLFMLDEFDNGHGGIMAGLNMALANGYVAFPDGMVTLHEDFLCVAGANTDGRGAKDGYIRQRLDYATLDRFTVVHVGYDEALEAELVRSTGIAREQGTKVLSAVRQARANVEAAGMDLVYSPRASLGMARGLVGGMSWPQVVTARLRRGLTEQEWAKVGADIQIAA